MLSEFASIFEGLSTGDNGRYRFYFWETHPCGAFAFMQGSPTGNGDYSGCQGIVRWEGGSGAMAADAGARVQGQKAWGKRGFVISAMRSLATSLQTGVIHEKTTAAVVPGDDKYGPAIWMFLRSPDYASALRSVYKKVAVATGSMLSVNFDYEHWNGLCLRDHVQVLPAPYSDDPTQWLFHGHPAFAEDSTQLHVALARVAGYRWPAETDTTIRLADLAKQRVALAAELPGTDSDGLLSLQATGADRPLADRLRALLAAAYGAPISPSQEADLIRAADAKYDKREASDLTLEAWLRDRAFRQHCVLFQQRPFLWHVWDGLKDGFAAFLNYHRLGYAALEKLTFTTLGDWIAKARAEGRTAHEGRALQLQQRLRLILDGEKPFDIFVRWKSLARQPIGWQPDFDDGVRLNIRPFMNAEVLREQPKINWNKDRGTDVASAPWYHLGPTYGGKQGDRINSHHLTLAEKRATQPQTKAS